MFVYNLNEILIYCNVELRGQDNHVWRPGA